MLYAPHHGLRTARSLSREHTSLGADHSEGAAVWARILYHGVMSDIAGIMIELAAQGLVESYQAVKYMWDNEGGPYLLAQVAK